MINASAGDNDPLFLECKSTCTRRCEDITVYRNTIRSYEAALQSPNSSKSREILAKYTKADIDRLYDTITTNSSWRTFNLWFMSWSCEQDCKYECMQKTNEYHKNNGKDVEKYYGKWPFIRVLGTQEFFSTIFSVANLLPFYHFNRVWLEQVNTTYYMIPLWFSYTISGINTWWWSTAFHARDNILTERLDYFFATFSILVLNYLAIVRIFKIRYVLVWFVMLAGMLSYFSWHCYTLHFIHFDYGWNMDVMVGLGLGYCLLWFIWAIIATISEIFSRQKKQAASSSSSSSSAASQVSDSATTNNTTGPYKSYIVCANILILIFASGEVFDFPPLFGLMDAHSMWHGATPICTYLTFKFALKDSFIWTRDAVPIIKHHK